LYPFSTKGEYCVLFAVHQARSNNIRLIAGLLLLGIFELSLINTVPLAGPTSDTLEELQPNSEPTPANTGDPGQIEENDPTIRIEEANPAADSAGRKLLVIRVMTTRNEAIEATEYFDVLKERKQVSSPGFELLMTILALASLPILLRRLRRA
jgi:hypothetical protein